jgi:RHS repeat-associated protein
MIIALHKNARTTSAIRAELVQYSYDATSRRIQRQHITFTNTQTTTYHYDAWNVIHECTTNSTLTETTPATSTKIYAWGLDLSNTLQGAGGVGGLLHSKTTTGETPTHHHYTYDANGNVSDLLTPTGTTHAHYEYDPFGNTIHFIGTDALSNTYRFSTKSFDAVSELYYYGHRFYDMKNGDWINRDPIGELGGMNLYCFLSNNPIGFVDVLGRNIFDDVIEQINMIIEAIDKIIGIPLPKAPVGGGDALLWTQMFADWFFERGRNPITYESDSPQSKDIAKSHSIKNDILPPFCERGEKKAQWQFTGPGTRAGTYGAAEWFLGSYNIAWIEASKEKVKLDITNRSHWQSGTRLPKTWTAAIKEATGFEITELVTSAPRGAVIVTKIENLIGIKIPDFLRNRIKISIGGDWNQTYKVEIICPCEKKDENP